MPRWTVGLVRVLIVISLVVSYSWSIASSAQAQTAIFQSNREALKNIFGSSSWNTPASQIPTDTANQQLVQYLYDNGTAARPGNFNITWNDHTFPIYIANANTPRYQVESSNPSWSNIHGKSIPFDPNWKPSEGLDNQIVIIDPTTNTYYDIWQFKGIVDNKIRVSNGSIIANYRTHSGLNSPSRGSGIAYAAMLVLPEEVAAGKIPHALSMHVRNTNTSFVAPAIKSDGNTPGGIPMGTRFALTMTDAQLEAWVASKPANLRTLARALGYALRDYGWVVTDSSGGASIRLEDYHTAGSQWSQITGIADMSADNQTLSDIMDGLDWRTARVLQPIAATSGTPAATPTPTPRPTATPTPQPSVPPTPKPTPSPTPSALPPTPLVCAQKTDLNNDGRINILDYSLLVNAFLTFNRNSAQLDSTTASADLNCDQKLNLIDYTLLVNAWKQ